MVFRLNDNASAKWMSDCIGVVDVEVRSESVSSDDVVESVNLVSEPKIFPHELQQLRSGQVVCIYREKAWQGEASPYFKIWPEYENRKPATEQLYGDPYPAKG